MASPHTPRPPSIIHVQMPPMRPASAAVNRPLRVLHVAAEAFPLIKTGGLADVMAALPQAQRLAQLGSQPGDADAVRLLLPGYPAVLDQLQGLTQVVNLGTAFGAPRVRLLLGRMPGTGLATYALDAPAFFSRQGAPYNQENGQAWADNLQRFALLGWMGAHLAQGFVDEAYTAQVLHAHDWHAAMACAYLAAQGEVQSRSVFSVHNLAYQGLFPMADAQALGLPSQFLSHEGLEFHGQLSFMKAGLAYAHKVTTVSPRYAKEMATAEFGCGLEGLVAKRSADVSGVLNGIDTQAWNPSSDAALSAPYAHFDASQLLGKAACKAALRQELGLADQPQTLLLAVVSRLTPQKGLDLLLQALPGLIEQGVQLALQGTGEAALVHGYTRLAAAYPQRVSVRFDYDEARAHRLIAGADAIAVPSRFEPCGLTQLYGLRYGTLPIARAVGGLADTVRDASQTLGKGNGFVFDAASPQALRACLERALQTFRMPSLWRALQQQAMAQDHSWAKPAQTYLGLYRGLVHAHASQQKFL